uniref:tRNA wybutosine-synthesizing protein 3 homolog n=1 Tax=Labrus bergylta TaxID=56723 RepID=A0A3Q3FEQ8_9LABR
VAINSGFRNSGLTVSKTGKILTAVRSTHGLEVPLSSKGKLLVDHDYIHFITNIANKKMEENLRRIQRSVCFIRISSQPCPEIKSKNYKLLILKSHRNYKIIFTQWRQRRRGEKNKRKRRTNNCL